MIWGKMINGQIIIHNKQQQGDKPVIFTQHNITPEQIEYAEWIEYNDRFEQKWTVQPSFYEPLPFNDEIALTHYINELTGGNDTDLVSAAETLIRNNMEE